MTENPNNIYYFYMDSNLSKGSTIQDINPIFSKWHKTVREESKDIWTDISLQTACEVLFEKWITTDWSRANNESTEVYYISIDIDSLNDNNKKILYTIQQEEDKLYKKYWKPWNYNFLIDNKEYNIQPWIIMEADIPGRSRDEKWNVKRKHANTITDVEAYFLSKVDLFEDQCEKKNWIIRATETDLNKVL
jgi:hypothetical protein